MKLVHDDGKVPSIFFPAGEPAKGGTCEFASPICLERCPSDTAPNALEKWIYQQFRERRADEMASAILMELLDRNELFLQWFAWGDCPSAMTEKITWIITKLKEAKVVQCGFTRNIALWKKVRRIIYMGLTVEDENKVVDYCEHGLVGCPDYEIGKVRIYHGTMEVKIGSTVIPAHRSSGGCGGSWVEEYEEPEYEAQPDRIFEANCIMCSKRKRGCFAYNLVEVLDGK